MIKFHTLGRVDLRDPSGTSLDDLLRQPKRVALLLYLALAEPAGFQRRDALLALFWPDLDTARARAALRKSLYFLRGALGPEVIVARGDDEVGVAREQLDCDALAFAAALAAGRIADALELYRGDLGEGFHVSDVSPEWERWLEERRVELRRRAADAARKQSAAATQAGEAEEAVRWARWAIDRAPDDEPGIRWLVELLGSRGDHAGAMQLYEEFRSRLRAEYDAEPSPETQALVAALGSRTAPPTSWAAPPTTAPPTAAPRAVKRARLSWRRPALLTTVTAVAVGTLFLIRPASFPALHPNLVAVAPFTILSPNLEVWREGMVDLLARNLDGAGPLQTVPPSRAVALWKGEVGSPSRLGHETGAGMVISGTLLGMAGDSLRVTASVLDLTTGRSIGDIEIAGTTDHMDLVVDSLTRQLLRAVGTARQIGSARYTSIGSRSVPALKAFLKGEQFRRQTSWDSVEVYDEEATELDSTFALAWLRLGEARAVSEFPVPLVSGPGKDDPWRSIHRAGTLNRGLSRHDSLVVAVAAGVAAFNLGLVPHGQWKAQSGQVYEAALEEARQYPNDPESWFGLGIVEDVLGDAIHTTHAQIYASYSRAIALDSGFAPAYRMALGVSGNAGDVSGTRRLAERYLTLDPSPTSRQIPRLIAGLLAPGTDSVAAQALVDSTPSIVLWPALLAVWRLPDSGEVGIRIAREMARRTPDPRYWFTSDWITRRNLAAVLAFRGHMQESLALAGDGQWTWFPDLFPELAMWGAVPAGRADSAFARWRALPGDTLGLGFALWWWAIRGDTADLRTVRLHPPPPSPSDLAFLALGRRDTAEALRQFAIWRGRGGADYYGLLAMARLLVARGQADEALTILRGRPTPYDWPIPSHVVWTLERARLSEVAGDREAASQDYRFVAEIWRYADSELQPIVAEARDAERVLAGERPLDGGAVRERFGQPQPQGADGPR